MSNFCYLVHQSEDYGENHVILAVFRDKQKAEKYCHTQVQLNPYDYIRVEEKQYEDELFDINTRVAEYYSYFIELDEPFDLKKIREENSSWESTDSQIYTYDNYVDLTDDSISCYSVKSYRRAERIALDYYRVLTEGKKKKFDYKIIDRRRHK